jgi:hypothetical protein
MLQPRLVGLAQARLLRRAFPEATGGEMTDPTREQIEKVRTELLRLYARRIPATARRRDMSAVDLRCRIAEAMELEKRATPAPWHAPGLGEVHSESHCDLFIAKYREIAAEKTYPADLVDQEWLQTCDCLSDIDAEFIVGIRNLFPELAASLDSAHADIARLRKALHTMLQTCTETDGGAFPTRGAFQKAREALIAKGPTK